MIQPLHDKILLEEILPPEELESGIIVPNNTKSMREPIAYVLAVGTNEDIKLNVGDKVIFDPGNLMQLTIEGQSYMLLPYRSVIAVVGKKASPIIEGGKL